MPDWFNFAAFDAAVLTEVDIVASVVLLAVLWITHRVVVRLLAHSEVPPLQQRRWITLSRSVLVFLALLALILIWAPQLRAFALSLTAVVVAIVIATKELILCLSGSLLRASSGAFTIGDRIEVGEIRGEVRDFNLLVTTLDEFARGPNSYQPTGRRVSIPNSVFLNTPVRNQRALQERTSHAFAVVLEPDPEIFAQRPAIEEIVRTHYTQCREDGTSPPGARDWLGRPDPSVTPPSVRLRTSDLGKLRIEVTMFCSDQEAERLESDITCDILARFAKPKDTAEKAAAAEQQKA